MDEALHQQISISLPTILLHPGSHPEKGKSFYFEMTKNAITYLQ